MHILFNKGEKVPKDLPEGTTLVERNKSGEKVLKAYEIKEKRLTVTRDFVEENRGWKRGEEERFLGKADFSKEGIIDFFIHRGVDGTTVPLREYKIYSAKTYDILQSIRTHGQCWCEEEKRYIGAFSLCLRKEDDLKIALEEMALVYNGSKDFLSEGVSFHIFEKSLSAGGVYYAIIKGRGVTLTKTTYGREKILEKFKSRKAFLKYVQDNLYYEE